MIDDLAALEEWVLRPSLEDVRLWRGLSRRRRLGVLAARSTALPSMIRQGSVVAAFRTENQRRVIAPVMHALGSEQPQPRASPPRVPMAVRLAHAARPMPEGGFWRSVDREFAVAGRTQERQVWRLLGARFSLTYRMREQLLSTQDACLVVATPQEATIRLLLQWATAIGVPTAYVPHAHLTRKAYAQDLPFTVAGVRGPRERDHFASIGADVARVLPVGDPSVDLLGRDTAFVPGAAGVIALSPDPPESIAKIFSLCAGLSDRDVIVAPHPSSRLEELRGLMPPRWRLNEGRTVERLKQGVGYLIQFSSGVAWEAAALGIPVLQLEVDDRPEDYYFLDPDPRIGRAGSSAAVAEWVDASTGSESGELRAFAEEWSIADGAKAASNAAELVAATAAELHQPLVLDGWASGGPASVVAEYSPGTAGGTQDSSTSR